MVRHSWEMKPSKDIRKNFVVSLFNEFWLIMGSVSHIHNVHLQKTQRNPSPIWLLRKCWKNARESQSLGIQLLLTRSKTQKQIQVFFSFPQQQKQRSRRERELTLVERRDKTKQVCWRSRRRRRRKERHGDAMRFWSEEIKVT